MYLELRQLGPQLVAVDYQKSRTFAIPIEDKLEGLVTLGDIFRVECIPGELQVFLSSQDPFKSLQIGNKTPNLYLNLTHAAMEMLIKPKLGFPRFYKPDLNTNQDPCVMFLQFCYFPESKLYWLEDQEDADRERRRLRTKAELDG